MKRILKFLSLTLIVSFSFVGVALSGVCEETPSFSEENGCTWTACGDSFIYECPNGFRKVIIL